MGSCGAGPGLGEAQIESTSRDGWAIPALAKASCMTGWLLHISDQLVGPQALWICPFLSPHADARRRSGGGSQVGLQARLTFSRSAAASRALGAAAVTSHPADPP